MSWIYGCETCSQTLWEDEIDNVGEQCAEKDLMT